MIQDFTKTIIVPCAGQSSRFGGGWKWRAGINDQPLLRHVIKPWIELCEKWIFVAGPNDDRLDLFLDTAGLHYEIMVQPEPSGIADAVARASSGVVGAFAVLLGDCIISGKFDSGIHFRRGLGVWHGEHPEDVRENFGVSLKGDSIQRVVEKPVDPSGFLCGMGIYFFDAGLRDFLRAEVERTDGTAHITEILQSWLNSRRELTPVMFDGNYINVNTVEDLKKSAEILEYNT